MGSRMHRSASSFLLATSLLAIASYAQKPAPSTSPGCGVLKGVTTCNWAGFRHVLTSAHVIAVEHSDVDRFTGKQLSELATHLGKSLASPGHPGDLTFVIVPAGEHGVDIGPADQTILKLQIHSGPSSSGELLWVETLRGDPERPWSSSVHSVIQQFEERLAKS
jgi:hypothetical protein